MSAEGNRVTLYPVGAALALHQAFDPGPGARPFVVALDELFKAQAADGVEDDERRLLHDMRGFVHKRCDALRTLIASLQRLARASADSAYVGDVEQLQSRIPIWAIASYYEGCPR